MLPCIRREISTGNLYNVGQCKSINHIKVKHLTQAYEYRALGSMFSSTHFPSPSKFSCFLCMPGVQELRLK